MSRLVLGQSEYFPISDTTVLVYAGTYTEVGQGLRSIDTMVVRFYGVDCNSSYCGYTKLIEKSGVTISLGDTTAFGPDSSMVYERMPVTFPFGPSADIRILTVDGKDTEVFFSMVAITISTYSFRTSDPVIYPGTTASWRYTLRGSESSLPKWRRRMGGVRGAFHC
jgi:hypothetical protein